MEKSYVRSLFDAIAARYDLLNHLLSAGIDFSWRRRAVEHLKVIKPRRILDVATGTGDFAIASLRLGPTSVIGVDLSLQMLYRARAKLRARHIEDLVSLAAGEAEHLGFPTGIFDAATVGFGARNFSSLTAGLAEMHRVLRPGGRVVILEFSMPARFPIRQIYLWYFTTIIPQIGRLISRHSHAYQYLPDTVLRFPEGEEFLALLRDAGFTSVCQERLTFGIATIYVGVRSGSAR